VKPSLSDLEINEELRHHAMSLDDVTLEALQEMIESECKFLHPIHYAYLDGVPIVVDGMNRLRLWRERLNQAIIAPPEIEEVPFGEPSIEAFKAWVSQHIISQRNVPPTMLHYHIGCMLDASPDSTRDAILSLSEKFGVSESTVRRARFFKMGIDSIREQFGDSHPAEIQGILQGEGILSGKQVQDIGNCKSPKAIQTAAQDRFESALSKAKDVSEVNEPIDFSDYQEPDYDPLQDAPRREVDTAIQDGTLEVDGVEELETVPSVTEKKKKDIAVTVPDEENPLVLSARAIAALNSLTEHMILLGRFYEKFDATNHDKAIDSIHQDLVRTQKRLREHEESAKKAKGK